MIVKNWQEGFCDECCKVVAEDPNNPDEHEVVGELELIETSIRYNTGETARKYLCIECLKGLEEDDSVEQYSTHNDDGSWHDEAYLHNEE